MFKLFWRIYLNLNLNLSRVHATETSDGKERFADMDNVELKEEISICSGSVIRGDNSPEEFAAHVT